MQRTLTILISLAVLSTATTTTGHAQNNGLVQRQLTINQFMALQKTSGSGSIMAPTLTGTVNPIAVQSDDLAQAAAAGKKAGKSDTFAFGWLAGGFFGSIIGATLAHTMPAHPGEARLLNKSADYRMTYTASYQQAVKSKRRIYSWIGAGANLALYIWSRSTQDCE
jgi:hypothetical protein